MRIYLDYAATSPVKPEVKKAILPYLENRFGNSSSIHQWGRQAKAAVEEAREEIAEFLNCNSQEIIFTSGGTEADNLAIRGIINSAKIEKPHIITTQIEHHAILKTCQHLEKNGQAEITCLKPNRDGLITSEQVKKAIKKNTILVSVGYVNNEIGTIQPIREIGKLIEHENRNRLKESGNKYGKQKIENGNTNLQSPISKPVSNFLQPISRIYFHTDAVQATQYLPMNVDFLHVDLLTISGHKIGAPKGIGALYIKKGVPINKILFGGEQEMNRRAGTENIIGIVGLGKAVESVISYQLSVINKTKRLRDYFIDRVLKEIPDTELNGSRENRSPNNANFYFKYIEGESILLNLDLVGIAASTGSACASQSLEPSHVILATYDNPERAHGSIRFTLAEQTTKEEIDYVIKNLKQIIKKLRDISPLSKKGK